jgi:protease I
VTTAHEHPAGSGGVKDQRVMFLATDGVEQVELTEPWNALKAAGAKVELVSLESGEIQGFNHLDKGDRFPVDHVVSAVKVSDFAALVLPGGVANPDALRMNKDAVRVVREFFEADKPVAAICHAPWLLIEADVLEGRTLTSWPSLRRDIENAGGSWVDKSVQVDQRLITSRKPEDLDAFCSKIVRDFAGAISENQLDAIGQQSFPASDPPSGPLSIGQVDRHMGESQEKR